MTHFESWLEEMVKVVVGEMNKECEPNWLDRSVSEDQMRKFWTGWSDLERRAAILLTQARALECRHLAGELTVSDPHSLAFKVIAARCLARSHKLEQIAMILAQPDGWPLKKEAKVVLQ